MVFLKILPHTHPKLKSIVKDNVINSNFVDGIRSKGPSNNRPNLNNTFIGYSYFDTDLGKVIYAKSISSKGDVIWADALGNPVNTEYQTVSE